MRTKLSWLLGVALVLAAAYMVVGRAQGNSLAPQATEVAILTGELWSGAEIPLPTYADGTVAQESECHWMVSPRRVLGMLESCGTTRRVVYLGASNGGGMVNYMIIATRSALPSVSTTQATWSATKHIFR
jgi:hypothetical protein